MGQTFSMSGQIRLVPSWVDTIGPASLTDATTFLQTLSIENGTGTGQANAYWRDVNTLAVDGSYPLDLTLLPLTVMGASGYLSLTPRLVYLRNRSATESIRWGSDYATFGIGPGGTFFWNSPTTVSPNPFTVASINNTGTATATYEILIVGVKS